jgi:hypothetical protein
MGHSAQLREQIQPSASPTAQPAHTDDHPYLRAALPDGATTSGTSTIAANGLGAAQHAPQLNSFWHRFFGGGDDRRPDVTNHIGAQRGGGPLQEGGPVSSLMRSVPYLGDYWEALANTHDSAHFQGALNPITAATNVVLPGPLMGLVDAPFRAFGSSLFLDK